MTALDLHSVAIIANWWLDEKIAETPALAKRLEKEIKATKELRKIAARLNDEDEIFIDKQPF